MSAEEDRAMTIGDLHRKFREDWSSGSKDIPMDRQTDKLIAILRSLTGAK